MEGNGLDKQGQRETVKLCVKLGKTGKQTYEMLKEEYGQSTISRSRVYDWYSRFKNGRTSACDNDRSGRPPSSTCDKKLEEISKIVSQDHRISMREIADSVDISYGSMMTVVTDHLKMRSVMGKFVPRLLTTEQKAHRVEVCQDCLSQAKEDPTFMSKIITSESCWIYGYDNAVSKRKAFKPKKKNSKSKPETVANSRSEAENQIGKRTKVPGPKMKRNDVRTKIVVFFDIHGIVHHEFITEEQDTDMTPNYYCEILSRLGEAIWLKRPDLLHNGYCVLQQENVPCHNSLKTRILLSKNNIVLAPHPQHSPDLTPFDFFLFPKLKFHLKNRKFSSVEEIQAETSSVIEKLDKGDFRKGFDLWQKRWLRCVDNKGEYIDGEGLAAMENPVQIQNTTPRKRKPKSIDSIPLSMVKTKTSKSSDKNKLEDLDNFHSDSEEEDLSFPPMTTSSSASSVLSNNSLTNLAQQMLRNSNPQALSSFHAGANQQTMSSFINDSLKLNNVTQLSMNNISSTSTQIMCPQSQQGVIPTKQKQQMLSSPPNSQSQIQTPNSFSSALKQELSSHCMPYNKNNNNNNDNTAVTITTTMSPTFTVNDSSSSLYSSYHQNLSTIINTNPNCATYDAQQNTNNNNNNTCLSTMTSRQPLLYGQSSMFPPVPPLLLNMSSKPPLQPPTDTKPPMQPISNLPLSLPHQHHFPTAHHNHKVNNSNVANTSNTTNNNDAFPFNIDSFADQL